MFRREINTIEMLPPSTNVMGEMIEIQRVISIELQVVENARHSILENKNITTCDEHGISVFESDMGITPLDTDTLDERKTRCLLKWNNTLPYNYQTVIALLDSLVGRGNYICILDGLVLSIKIDYGSVRQINTIFTSLRSIVPANVVIETSVIPNTWGDISRFTWGKLAQDTWKNIQYDKKYREVP